MFLDILLPILICIFASLQTYATWFGEETKTSSLGKRKISKVGKKIIVYWIVTILISGYIAYRSVSASDKINDLLSQTNTTLNNFQQEFHKEIEVLKTPEHQGVHLDLYPSGKVDTNQVWPTFMKNDKNLLRIPLGFINSGDQNAFNLSCKYWLILKDSGQFDTTISTTLYGSELVSISSTRALYNYIDIDKKNDALKNASLDTVYIFLKYNYTLDQANVVKRFGQMLVAYIPNDKLMVEYIRERNPELKSFLNKVHL